MNGEAWIGHSVAEALEAKVNFSPHRFRRFSQMKRQSVEMVNCLRRLFDQLVSCLGEWVC